MIDQNYSGAAIRLARVTKAHPEGQKMEVIFLDNGDFGRDIQVMSPMAGTDFGFTGGLPDPDEVGHEPNMTDNVAGTRHILAIVANLSGLHVCLGFLPPQVSEMAFTKDDQGRLIERSASDFVRTVSSKGDLDMVHPGGAYLRIGSGTVPDVLEGKDFDKIWKIRRNKGPVPITLASGTSRITINPSGDILITTSATVIVDAKTIDMNAAADITMTAGGSVKIEAGADVAIAAPSVTTTAAVITNAASLINEETPAHRTTGVHVDANGVHS